MKRLLLLLLLLPVTLSAQPPTVNGRGGQPPVSCQVVHNDQPVNTLVTVTTPAPPAGQYVAVCGIDWQVVEDTTGTAQANVLWTSTNLGSPSWAAEYSIAATPSALVSGAFYPSFAMRANLADRPVTVVSPAVALHAAYSANVYFTFVPQ